jgi:hypothetical protein
LLRDCILIAKSIAGAKAACAGNQKLLEEMARAETYVANSGPAAVTVLQSYADSIIGVVVEQVDSPGIFDLSVRSYRKRVLDRFCVVLQLISSEDFAERMQRAFSEQNCIFQAVKCRNDDPLKAATGLACAINVVRDLRCCWWLRQTQAFKTIFSVMCKSVVGHMLPEIEGVLAVLSVRGVTHAGVDALKRCDQRTEFDADLREKFAVVPTLLHDGAFLRRQQEYVDIFNLPSDFFAIDGASLLALKAHPSLPGRGAQVGAGNFRLGFA